LKRRKSINSQAASISAWNTVLPPLSIEPALICARYLTASSSAALRKIAARSSQRSACQSFCAATAASMARCTSSGPALW